MTKVSMKIKSQIFFRLKIIYIQDLRKSYLDCLQFNLKKSKITNKGELGFMSSKHNPKSSKYNMKIELKTYIFNIVKIKF